MGFENYEDYSVARASTLAVLQAIPVVGGVAQVADAAFAERSRRMNQERRDTLPDELETGARDLTRNVALTDPMVHAAYVTVEAALRTSRKEKIRWFARLLLAGLGEDRKLDLEREHETYLTMLDELSVQEVAILTTLAKYEAASGKAVLETTGQPL